MATPKILGSAPEPYDGKPEKADAFINNLGNYYFLNTTTFDTDEKKVFSALTYFKIGTPAGEWAHDRQSALFQPRPQILAHGPISSPYSKHISSQPTLSWKPLSIYIPRWEIVLSMNGTKNGPPKPNVLTRTHTPRCFALGKQSPFPYTKRYWV
jgi:hypothetical protein